MLWLLIVKPFSLFHCHSNVHALLVTFMFCNIFIWISMLTVSSVFFPSFPVFLSMLYSHCFCWLSLWLAGASSQCFIFCWGARVCTPAGSGHPPCTTDLHFPGAPIWNLYSFDMWECKAQNPFNFLNFPHLKYCIELNWIEFYLCSAKSEQQLLQGAIDS